MSTPESTLSAAESLRRDPQFKVVTDATELMEKSTDKFKGQGFWVVDIRRFTPKLKAKIDRKILTHAEVEKLARTIGWEPSQRTPVDEST